MRDLLILNMIILNVLSDDFNTLAMSKYGSDVQTVVCVYLFATFFRQLHMMCWVQGALVDKLLVMWL